MVPGFTSVVVLGSAALALFGQSQAERCSYEAEHMATTFRIVAYAPDCEIVSRAVHVAFEHIERLDSLFSDYRPDSEIARLASGAGEAGLVPVSPELWSILEQAQFWASRTDGAFDVTIGPVTRLWRWSARRAELPAPARLAVARAAVGFRYLEMDSGTQRVRLDKPGMSLDLGGIAKGYAADAAMRILSERGLHAVLIDAGGDLALGDPPPHESGWLVTLPSGESIRLARAAIATSGDTYRFITVGGVRYSHIVDPQTGLGVVDGPIVTVVAPDATTADALASALTVMDRASGEALVRSVDGAWQPMENPGRDPT